MTPAAIAGVTWVTGDFVVIGTRATHAHDGHINTLSLPKRPGATLGQGPVACSWDASRLLQLHKRTQRAFN